MPLPTIAGTVRASFRGLMPSGRPWVNVHHWRYAGGASTPGLTEVTALDTKLVRLYSGAVFGAGSPWLSACNTATTLIDANYYPLSGAALPYLFSHSAAGGSASNSLPSEVAHVLTLRTNTRGRSYRGRIYLPASVIANMTSAGALNATPIAAIIAQWTGLVASLVADQWEPVVASYLHSVATPITAVTMDAKSDVQRHRK